MTGEAIQETVERLLPEAVEFLGKLISFPSLPGREHEAMLFLEEAFGRTRAEIERVPLDDSIKADPDYSDPLPDIRYDGRFNLRLRRKGKGGGRKLLLNAHVDVVPPSEGMDDPWTPRMSNGELYGRGACDDKGQVALVYLLFRALDEMGVETAGDLTAHLVVEEENGGNGTLAMIRTGEIADGCVVLEPSDRRVFTSIRGAVWFRVELSGTAGHSGEAGVTRSALLLAREAMAILEEYQAGLLARSRGIALFDPFPNPMPITFGQLRAGNWPAAAPSRATLEGVLGFLPNKTKEEVCREMEAALREGADGALEGNFRLHFMYRHDCSVLDPGHDLPQTLLAAARSHGMPLEISAMTASCDAWFYNNQLGIPTIVHGAGTLKVAHSKDERIALRDISECGSTLCSFVRSFCGVG